jgi:hypothetical protein
VRVGGRGFRVVEVVSLRFYQIAVGLHGLTSVRDSLQVGVRLGAEIGRRHQQVTFVGG